MGKLPTIDDPVRRAISAAIDRLGLSPKQLSEEAGLNHAYLHQFLKQGKPRALPETFRKFLAARLSIPEDELSGPAPSPAPRAIYSPNAAIGPSVALGGAPLMPVYGQAVGGIDGRFILNGQRIADVMTPPALIGVRDAYAVYVQGSSMEPRYLAGETAYVHPHFPVKTGDFVVVQLAGPDGEPPEGYIKQFLSIDARSLRLRQLNPRKTIVYPAQRVISIHRIVLAG